MSANSPSAPRRILLIDDDELIASSLRQYLIRQSIEVDVALEASAADSFLRSGMYDVVMCDPYLTGGVREDDDVLISGIRDHQPAAALIILTGYASPALRDIAGREHAMAVLTKPQPVSFLSQFVADAAQKNSHSLPAKGQSE